MTSKKTIIGFIISGLCLWLACRAVDLSSVMESLTYADGRWLFAASVIIAVTLCIRGQRWQRLLYPLAPNLGWMDILHTYNLGNFANLIMPLRGGDVVRAFLIARHGDLSRTAALATVVSERLIDIITFLGLLAACYVLYPMPVWMKTTGIIFGAIAVISVSLIAFLKRNVVTSGKGVLSNFSMLFVGSMQKLDGKRDYIFFVLETILMWVFQGIAIFCIFASLGLDETYGLGIGAVLLVLTMTTIAVSIPSSPSFAGTLHLTALWALELSGVPADEGLTFAILYHATCVVVGIFLGVIALWHQGLQWRGFTQARTVA